MLVFFSFSLLAICVCGHMGYGDVEVLEDNVFRSVLMKESEISYFKFLNHPERELEIELNVLESVGKIRTLTVCVMVDNHVHTDLENFDCISPGESEILITMEQTEVSEMLYVSVTAFCEEPNLCKENYLEINLVASNVEVVGNYDDNDFVSDLYLTDYDPWPTKNLVRKSLEEIEEEIEVGDCIFIDSVLSTLDDHKSNIAHVIQACKVVEEPGEKRRVFYVELTITGFFVREGLDYLFIDSTLDHPITWLAKLDKTHRMRMNEKVEELVEWELEMVESLESLGFEGYGWFSALANIFENTPVLGDLQKINIALGPKEEHFFCSGFIAAAFYKFGVLGEISKPFQWNLLRPSDFLKFQIWEEEVVQFFGYDMGKKKGEVLVPPIDFKDFLSVDPEEWNNNIAEEKKKEKKKKKKS